MTANLYAPGKINLSASNLIELTEADVNARNQIVIQADSADVLADGATIQAAAAGSSTVEIDAGASVVADGATLGAAKSVDVSAGSDIFASGSTIVATPHYLGSVALNAVGSIIADGEITATKDVQIDAGDELIAVAKITVVKMSG